MAKLADLQLLYPSKIGFTLNLNDRKMLKFSHCVQQSVDKREIFRKINAVSTHEILYRFRL